MKKINFLLILALLLSGLTTSCKKGEDDPFMSLRSRKARMAGEWKVSSYTLKDSDVSANGSSTSIATYDGTTRSNSTLVLDMGDTTSYSASTETYTQNFTFEKDGTFIYTDNRFNTNTRVEGTWAFVAKNKKNELKNKEAILLTITKLTASGGTVTYTGLKGDVYEIRQLKNKETVLVLASSETTSSTTHTREEMFTLTQN